MPSIIKNLDNLEMITLDKNQISNLSVLKNKNIRISAKKQEIYYGVVYYSYEELKSEIERYIKYYNEQRIKEKLGWLSPVQYRLNLLAA